MRKKKVQANLMFVLALTISIICFFLMDSFVAAEGNAKPNISCSVVS